MTIHLFVYGTLRPDGALDYLTPGEHIGKGYMPGQLYRHRDARFPVLVEHVNGAPYPTVTGDLFRIHDVDLHRLDPVTDMEVGAGYDVRLRRVMRDRTDNPDVVTALVFTYSPHKAAGPRIHCGDWHSVEAVEACRDLHNNAGFTSRRASH